MPTIVDETGYVSYLCICGHPSIDHWDDRSVTGELLSQPCSRCDCWWLEDADDFEEEDAELRYPI